MDSVPAVTLEVRGEKPVNYSELHRAHAVIAYTKAEHNGKSARLRIYGHLMLECGTWPDPIEES